MLPAPCRPTLVPLLFGEQVMGGAGRPAAAPGQRQGGGGRLQGRQLAPDPHRQHLRGRGYAFSQAGNVPGLQTRAGSAAGVRANSRLVRERDGPADKQKRYNVTELHQGTSDYIQGSFVTSTCQVVGFGLKLL